MPYSEFDSAELALQLHDVVRDNASLLKARNLLGPLARYGHDLNRAKDKVEKGQREHVAGTLGHFAVVNNENTVIGSASIYPGLSPYKLKAPLPAGISRQFPFMAVDFPGANLNIHAWTNDDGIALEQTYKELFDVSPSYMEYAGDSRHHLTWTVEPFKSPQYVHEAIVASGLGKVTSGRYDEGDSRFAIPPRGVLYATDTINPVA